MGKKFKLFQGKSSFKECFKLTLPKLKNINAFYTLNGVMKHFFLKKLNPNQLVESNFNKTFFCHLTLAIYCVVWLFNKR